MTQPPLPPEGTAKEVVADAGTVPADAEPVAEPVAAPVAPGLATTTDVQPPADAPNNTLISELHPDLVAAAAELDRTDPTTSSPSPGLPDGISEKDLRALRRFAKLRQFLERHGSKLWWLHSAYALSFGAFIVMYASKGYENARWMVVLLGAGWVVLVVFFRMFGSGRGQLNHIKDTRTKIRFYLMTLALKNLFQSMLFFLLPFYYKTASFDHENRFFVYALALMAVLSTVDVVFDQFVMRWKGPASAVYFFILFACLNLVLPALLPDSRTLLTQLAAAAIAGVVFFSMLVPLRKLIEPLYAFGLVLLVAGAVFGVYFARYGIPPVPMYISSGAVGPELLPDGRLTMQVSALHESLIQEMHALTDVVSPGGRGNTLFHVWRHEGLAVQRGPVDPYGTPPPGTIRLRSTLRSFNLPSELHGHWNIDVVTEDDQLVGRVHFEVID